MIRIGILGAGRVTENRYVDVFNNELANAQVAVLADPVRAKADKVAAKLGCRAVYSEQGVFSDAAVDAVLICTESGNHLEHARSALLAGKHVIVEKPPAMKPDQVEEMRRLAEKQGLMYACIFQNRFNPAMVKLKETYDSGRFGKIVLATIRLRWCRYQPYYEDGWHGTFAMDGGVLNQQAIHHVDALQWICGPILAVNATMTRALNRLEAEDTAVATVKFANGALGAIETTTAARPEDFEASLSIVAEEGLVVVGGIALNKIDTWRFVKPVAEDALVPGKYSQEVPTGYGLSHGPLMQEIIDRLAAGRIDPPISAADAIPTVRLVHALYASDEKQGWVNLADNPLSSRLGRPREMKA